LPAVIADPGAHAGRRFIEFFNRQHPKPQHPDGLSPGHEVPAHNRHGRRRKKMLLFPSRTKMLRC
jgi:hypothetical protein